MLGLAASLWTLFSSAGGVGPLFSGRFSGVGADCTSCCIIRCGTSPPPLPDEGWRVDAVAIGREDICCCCRTSTRVLITTLVEVLVVVISRSEDEDKGERECSPPEVDGGCCSPSWPPSAPCPPPPPPPPACWQPAPELGHPDEWLWSAPAEAGLDVDALDWPYFCGVAPLWLSCSLGGDEVIGRWGWLVLSCGPSFGVSIAVCDIWSSGEYCV